jgi:hypothetical protein
MERYILINKLSVDTLMNPIDYEKADSCMEKLTQKAFSYIEKALK